MTDKVEEQISALIDLQHNEEEFELLFKRMQKDPDLRRCWSRYQLMQDAMANHLPEQVDINFAERMHGLIDAEPSYTGKGPINSAFRRVMKPVAGLAVAASVASATIVTVQNVSISDIELPIISAKLAANPDADAFSHVNGMHWSTRRPEVDRRLNGYLVNHTEYSSSTNLQGMVHYVRIAGYDKEQ